MPVRLVATDLDGTLLDPDGQVSARTVAAVAGAREASIDVVPVTGRPPHATWDLARRAGLGPLGICSNGAVTIDLEQGRIVDVESLAADIAHRLVTVLRETTPGIRLAGDIGGRFCYEHDFFELPADWDEPFLAVADIAEAIGPDCLKLIARHPPWSAGELIAHVAGRMGEEAHLTTSGLDWVEIGAPGVTKAFALERLCRRLQVGVDEVVAVGDHHNDLPLLAWAGTAMAPANAIPEVLAVAGRILPTNADHAVAVLLEELVAGR